MKNIIKSGKIEECLSGISFNGELRYLEEMKKHTSLKIGGPADVFAIPFDFLSIKNLLIALKTNGISFTPFGGGTNVLVKDGGIEGVVMSLKSFKTIRIINEEKSCVDLYIEAGTSLNRFVNFTKENGYSGVEWLVGIPGLIGGAICGNAGAFGYETKDVLRSVWIMDDEGSINKRDIGDINFEYRSSDFSMKEIILAGEVRLRKDKKEDISSRIENFMRKKRETQPISELSAGCVFKNPPGISAGKLIDEAGCKGMKIGDIEVSRLHANFFINTDKGSAHDFIRLMEVVAQRVKENFGITLEPEIKIIGRECVNG